MNNKNVKWQNYISYVYCILMFCVYYIGYNSPFGLIRDTYGLSNGIIKRKAFYDFFGMIDYCYITIVNGLFRFMGEKVSVITGFHIACGFLSFILLYFAVKKFYKPYLTYLLPACFVVVPFLLCDFIEYDGFVLIAFGICLLFFITIQVIFHVANLDFNPEVILTESLSERELRESQKPKTIVNDKGETIQLIANPLPGPKKHIKRTLDYDLDVPQEKMYYDIDSDTFDDYELK